MSNAPQAHDMRRGAQYAQIGNAKKRILKSLPPHLFSYPGTTSPPKIFGYSVPTLPGACKKKKQIFARKPAQTRRCRPICFDAPLSAGYIIVVQGWPVAVGLRNTLGT
jgi:hypothetical protein